VPTPEINHEKRSKRVGFEQITNVFNGFIKPDNRWHGRCLIVLNKAGASWRWLDNGCNVMKMIRYLILMGMTIAGLCEPRAVRAQTPPSSPPPPPPTAVVPENGTLTGIPQGIKVLIVDFAVLRDKYLAQQNLLLLKLGNATTATERQQIRDQLEDNRADFMAELKGFRTQLKSDLEALKGKISHEEFLRIINAAYDATHEGGFGHHKS
jgi:hypothetical protein